MTAGNRRRKLLARFGPWGDQVRVRDDARARRVVVYYRDRAGIPHKRIFPRDKQGRDEALAWAAAYHAERERLAHERERPAPITLRALWRHYQGSPAWADLRPKTQVNYAQRFTRWVRFFGDDALAGDLTLLDIDRFIVRGRTVGIAINQVRQTINVARIVFNWGVKRKLLPPHEISLYRWRAPKDAVVHQPAEYSGAEFDAILAALPPQDPKTWRAHVVWLLTGGHGPRANAVLHLRWRDVDRTLGVLRWPAAFQKNGREHVQPLSWDAIAALETARYHQARLGAKLSRVAIVRRPGLEYQASSEFVVPSHGRRRQAAGEPWSYQGLWRMLRAAEDRAGVRHQLYRGLHGLRRKVTGDIIDATGDRMLGLEFIGDSDPKQLAAYDKRKAQRITAAGAALEARNGPRGGCKPSPNRPSPPAPDGGDDATPHHGATSEEPAVGIEPTTAFVDHNEVQAPNALVASLNDADGAVPGPSHRETLSEKCPGSVPGADAQHGDSGVAE